MNLKKVLLIDDEEDICFLTKINLEQSGRYIVDTAFSGEDGLGLFHQHNYDVVITDFKMGGISGKDVIKSIKKEKPEIPVFIFSIFHDDPDSMSEIEEMAEEVLKKPIHSDMLIQSLDNYFRIKE